MVVVACGNILQPVRVYFYRPMIKTAPLPLLALLSAALHKHKRDWQYHEGTKPNG